MQKGVAHTKVFWLRIARASICEELVLHTTQIRVKGLDFVGMRGQSPRHCEYTWLWHTAASPLGQQFPILLARWALNTQFLVLNLPSGVRDS